MQPKQTHPLVAVDLVTYPARRIHHESRLSCNLLVCDKCFCVQVDPANATTYATQKQITQKMRRVMDTSNWVSNQVNILDYLPWQEGIQPPLPAPCTNIDGEITLYREIGESFRQTISCKSERIPSWRQNIQSGWLFRVAKWEAKFRNLHNRTWKCSEAHLSRSGHSPTVRSSILDRGNSLDPASKSEVKSILLQMTCRAMLGWSRTEPLLQVASSRHDGCLSVLVRNIIRLIVSIDLFRSHWWLMAWSCECTLIS